MALILVLTALYVLRTTTPPPDNNEPCCAPPAPAAQPIDTTGKQQPRNHPLHTPTTVWRAELNHPTTAAPLALDNSWLTADNNGNITCFNSSNGTPLWYSSYSNLIFSGATLISKNQVALAAESGTVIAINTTNGNELWQVELKARLFHPPLAGTINDHPALWLVSQSDGQLFCLAASDGSLLWQGDATNRCDGPATAWPGHLGYGNCDGAIYIFDATNGRQLAKISVGDQDQMAGAILVMPDNRLAAGTRSGNLAIVNPTTQSCDATLKVSEGEAFITPVMLTPQLLAMGNDEGEVTLWHLEDPAPTPAGNFDTRHTITSLHSYRSHLIVMSDRGATIWHYNGTKVGAVNLGDDLGPLSLNSTTGMAALIADGALLILGDLIPQ